MRLPTPRLLFGGTFDPVHRAHLLMAREAMACLELDRLSFLPAGDPPHRAPPGASAEHRLRMLALACAGDPRLQIDRRELHRQGPSYSVLSLREYRAECPSGTPLVLVLGVDAAAGLASWHQAGQLSALCQLLVLARPGAKLDPALPEQLGWRRATQLSALTCAPAGNWFLHNGPQAELSASAVRKALADADPVLSDWLDPAVLDYIRSQDLYRSKPPG